MDAWETLTPLFRETTHDHMLRSFWDPESWDDAAHEAKLELMREHMDMCFYVQCTGGKRVWGNASWLFTFPPEVIIWCGAHVSWDKSHRRIPSLKRDRET